MHASAAILDTSTGEYAEPSSGEIPKRSSAIPLARPIVEPSSTIIPPGAATPPFNFSMWHDRFFASTREIIASSSILVYRHSMSCTGPASRFVGIALSFCDSENHVCQVGSSITESPLRIR